MADEEEWTEEKVEKIYNETMNDPFKRLMVEAMRKDPTMQDLFAKYPRPN